MAGGVCWGERKLTALPIGDGRSFFCPRFCDEAGLDKDELFSALSRPELFQPPDAPHMRYRGNMLARVKFFVSHAPVEGVTPAYRYPGFCWEAVAHYMTLETAPAQLGGLLQGLRNKLSVDGSRHEYSQTIGTLYRDGDDSIGWHADKAKDIAEDSLIVDVSLGAERTFSLRAKGAEAGEEFVMEHGSAVLLSTATNAAYEHAVLKQPHGAGPRVSLVFRNIQTQLAQREVEKRINAAARAKGRREAKRQKCGSEGASC